MHAEWVLDYTSGMGQNSGQVCIGTGLRARGNQLRL